MKEQLKIRNRTRWHLEDNRQFGRVSDLKTVEHYANMLRLDVVKSIFFSEDGHPGPSMSIADMLAFLYFYEMDINPTDPNKKNRDRLVLSKGHACPMLYATLARRGYFPVEDLLHLRMLESHLQGHPDMHKTNGVDMTSGSLGNGLAIAVGMALGARYQQMDSRYFVITGDGELNEGSFWESMMSAAQHKLGRITVLVDANKQQSGGSVEQVSGIYPLAPKFEAFGWHVLSVDGHDVCALKKAVDEAGHEQNRPSILVCDTVKGKGIPYMENNNAWHKKVPSAEEVDQAFEAIGGLVYDRS